MDRLNRSFPLKHFFPILTLLLILGFLATQFAPVVLAQPEPATSKPLLCGKLLFLKVLGTGATELGLMPCGETQPLVFDTRPRELFNYYRFTNVTIKSGDPIKSEKYGSLSKFITNWGGYIEIKSCQECSSPSPSETSTYPPIPTQPPTLTPTITPTETALPSPTQSLPPPAPPTPAPTPTPEKLRNPLTYCCSIFGLIPAPLAALAWRKRARKL